MKKIRDRIVLGIVAGIAETLVKDGLNALARRTGLSKADYAPVAAGLFGTKKQVRSTTGQVAGRAANYLMGTVVGIGTTYLLSMTGTDYHWLKGPLLANGLWLGTYGVLPELGVGSRHLRNPVTALSGMVQFTAMGLAIAAIAKTLGDEALFTDARDSFQIPVVGNMPGERGREVLTQPDFERDNVRS